MGFSNCRSVQITLAATVLLTLVNQKPVDAQEPSRNEDEVTTLIQQLESESPSKKLDAATRLSSLGPYAHRAVSALSRTLASDNSAVKYEALVALGSIGPLATESVAEVSAVLSSDLEPLQVAALEALRRIGMPLPTADMQKIESLTSDSSDAVMSAAVRCLIALEDENTAAITSSVARLISALSSARPSVRNAAATALVEIGDSVIPALRMPLSAEQRTVRLKACEISGRLGPAAADLIPLLLKRLNDDDELVMRSAATALGRIQGNFDLVLPELERLLTHNSAAVRADVLLALMEFGRLAKDAVPMVCDMMLMDDSSLVRSAAARLLGQIGGGSEHAAQTLAKAIQDSHGGVTVQAANALGNLGPVGVPVLLELLDSPEYRDLAVSILGEIGPEASGAVPSLLALLNAEDDELRREVFIALATIGPGAQSAVPELLKRLSHPSDAFSAAGAAYVLGNIGDQSCLPLLKKILNDSATDVDTRVLRATAWALVTLQPGEAANAGDVLPHLVTALSSERPLVRKEALAAIGKLGSAAQPASDRLIQLAKNDRDPVVRSEALHTLALLPDISDAALPIAIAAMDDDRPELRIAARFLLGQMGPAASIAAAGLKKGTREGSELDRIVSAWALLRVQPSDEHAAQAVPFMLIALRHPNPQVRTEGARTLGAIGIRTEAVMTALQAATSDEISEVASAAEKSLQQLQR